MRPVSEDRARHSGNISEWKGDIPVTSKMFTTLNINLPLRVERTVGRSHDANTQGTPAFEKLVSDIGCVPITTLLLVVILGKPSRKSTMNVMRVPSPSPTMRYKVREEDSPKDTRATSLACAWDSTPS